MSCIDYDLQYNEDMTHVEVLIYSGDDRISI